LAPEKTFGIKVDDEGSTLFPSAHSSVRRAAGVSVQRFGWKVELIQEAKRAPRGWADPEMTSTEQLQQLQDENAMLRRELAERQRAVATRDFVLKNAGAITTFDSVRTIEGRTKTFVNWPHARYIQLRPEDLAAAGFFFTPSTAYPDRVTCAYCSLELGGWEDNNSAVQVIAWLHVACVCVALARTEGSGGPSRGGATPDMGVDSPHRRTASALPRAHSSQELPRTRARRCASAPPPRPRGDAL
jgi:hypothetical protein